jgi:hypothetical protein
MGVLIFKDYTEYSEYWSELLDDEETSAEEIFEWIEDGYLLSDINADLGFSVRMMTKEEFENSNLKQ